MAEKEYIEREAVLKIIYDIKENKEIPKNYGTLLDIIRSTRNLPAAAVAEVRYGEWIFNSHQAYGEPSYFCSLCVGDRGSETGKDNYCPDCGAKMMGGKNG